MLVSRQGLIMKKFLVFVDRCLEVAFVGFQFIVLLVYPCRLLNFPPLILYHY
jgi:hypothetical protein